MQTDRVDRRVRYTKALLRDALVELMQTQHISAISVKALCDIADVNRSTFYAHYSDPYDLLNQIEREVLANLKRYLDRQDFNSSEPLSVQILTSILDYIKENAALSKALLSENCDFAIQKDIMELAQIISEQIYPKLDIRTMEYIKEFGINGCVSVLQKWLREGTPEPPALLAELMIQLMYFGMKSFQ